MILLYENEKIFKKFYKFLKKNLKNKKIKYYIKINEIDKYNFDKKNKAAIIVVKELNPFLKSKIKNLTIKEIWVNISENNFILFNEKEK